MWDLKEVNWVSKYKSKRENTKKRGVSFELTKEQYIHLYTTNGGVCDYTGETLVLGGTADNSSSLERISEFKGYTLDNCIIVSNLANQMKRDYLEMKHGCNDAKLSVDEKKTLTAICSVVFNPIVLESVQSKYLGSGKKSSNSTYKVPDTSREVEIAELYVLFGKHIEKSGKVEFLLTYAQFKQLILRKKCMLTGRPLEVDLSKVGFYIVDKSLPVSKGNVFATTKSLQIALDSLVKTNKLSNKDIQKLCAVLQNNLN